MRPKTRAQENGAEPMSMVVGRGSEGSAVVIAVGDGGLLFIGDDWSRLPRR